MEREGRAISLLPGFEIVEEPTDVGEQEVADLGLLVERGFDLGKRILEVPVFVGEGKRGPDLFEARGVLPVAQEPIGLQGLRQRKTPRIEIQGGCPGKKPCPSALIGREAVSRKIPTPRGLDQVGRKPLKGLHKGSCDQTQ